jgi:hypothetical protein
MIFITVHSGSSVIEAVGDPEAHITCSMITIAGQAGLL